jgi:rubrerythrin
MTSREYCLAHPVEISRLYGVNVLFGALIGNRSALDQIAANFAGNRLAMPGPLGQSYRVATLIELRAAKIYRLLAERFVDVLPVRRLFKELEEEEMEHARVMNVCLYAVRMRPHITYVPSMLDPEVRDTMKEMRAAQRRIPTMTLDEAFKAAVALEVGEANLIFGKLLKQVAEPEVAVLREMMRNVETHQVSVPRRIDELRRELAKLGIVA